MTALARTLVVAQMQARDLRRRRVVMALFVALPAAFYYSVPATEGYGLLAGSIGVSWAAAAAGLFGMLGWRRADPRLALAGAKPHHGILGRLLVLQALAFGLVALFAPQILVRSAALIADGPAILLALVLMALASAPLGLAIGALVPRELEGTLLLIGIIGVEMSVPPDSALAAWLPLYGPLRVLVIGAGLSDQSIAGGVVHALISTVVLLGAAYWLWRRRLPSPSSSPTTIENRKEQS